MVITVTCPSCSSAFPVDPAKVPEGGVNARCTSCGDIFRVEKPAEPPPVPTLEPLPDLVPVAPLGSDPEFPVPEDPAPHVPDLVDDAPAPELPSEPEAPRAVDAPAASEAPESGLEPMPELTPFEAEPLPELTPFEGEAPTATDPFARTAPFEEGTVEQESREEAPAEEVPSEPGPEPEAPAVQGFTFGKRDPTDKARRLARVLVSDMIMYNAERHQSALAAGTLVQDFEEEIDKSWKEFVEQVGEELANGVGREFWTNALNDILAKGEKVF